RVHLRSRLTLYLGFLYDYFRPIQPRNNASDYSIYNPANNTLVPVGTQAFNFGPSISPVPNGPLTGLNRFGGINANHLNFAPRVGLAYRVNDRTVVRAGYGMSYWNGALQFAASSLIPAATSAENGVAGGFGATGPFGLVPSAVAS